MRGVNQKIKVFTLGTTLLLAGVASAQMLDDDTYGSWGALEIEQAGEQSTDSQDNFMPEVPVIPSSSSSSSVSLGGARLNDVVVDEPKEETVDNAEMVSWSNDATPPARIYSAKDVREDANGVMWEIATGQLVNGEVRDYYPMGRMLSKVRYADGLKQGRALMFFQNGTLLSEAFYNQGKEEGDISVFYFSGDEYIRASFNDGVPVSGYCVKMNGEKIQMTTAQLREFKDNGKTPCDNSK